MDWFSWLSKTGLDPTLVYEYGLLFSRNELEEEDVPHFDHPFLQSMGISIAKHRLHILNLKNKDYYRRPSPGAARRLLAAARAAKDNLLKYLQSLARRESPAAIVVMPARAPHGGRRGSSLKRLLFMKQGSLVLTDGGTTIVRSHSASPMVCNKSAEDGDDGFWGSGGAGEEMRWDSMFQDLKPT